MAVQRDEVEVRIRSAFAGVTLGSGISALQSEATEDYLERVTLAEYRALPRSETTDDWTAIPDAELIHVLTPPHLDFQGMRYYLPALLIWLLDNYDRSFTHPLFNGDMTVIFTVNALAPYEGSRWLYWKTYDKFSDGQRGAIARYVHELPHLVQLRPDDKADLESAAIEYWNQFLTD